MKATRQTPTDPNEDQQYGKWMRLAMWYRRTPVLREINPFAFPAIILSISLASIFPKGHCTCEDQLPDQHLSVMAKEGNKEVIAHLSARDNALLCATKRQELLKELERKKQHLKMLQKD